MVYPYLDEAPLNCQCHQALSGCPCDLQLLCYLVLGVAGDANATPFIIARYK
jgi:hypothetical protein